MIRQIDRAGFSFWLGIVKTWNETTFREIFGIGMILIGLAAAYQPAGAVMVANEQLGISPLLFAVWFTVCGYLLSRYGNRGMVSRLIYTMPMLFYIALTVVFISQSPRLTANYIVLIQYLLLYIAMIKLIVDDDG